MAQKTVIAFGVFDGLHKGHAYFLQEAKKLGDYLIAVTPSDDIVKKIKNHLPKNNLQERVKHLRSLKFIDEVVPSNESLNNWGILEKYQPDIIAIGYDQARLKTALENHFKKTSKKIELKVISSFEPHKYKSSLIA